MNDTLFTVDAFTAVPYTGNPAAVCLLDESVGDAWMQAVAREMNLSETAFLLPLDGGYSLRWFTPVKEVGLCGHATLASAHVLWETETLPRGDAARFHTRSGWLTCRLEGSWIEMDFPALRTDPASAPAALLDGLGVDPVFVGNVESVNWVLEVANEQILTAVRPRFDVLRTIEGLGFIVTARSQSPEYDFVSRYFAPGAGIDEDPVTGSAHCALGPYWRQKLGKCDFTAYQASARGGVIKVGVREDRVLLGGQAQTIATVKLLRSPNK